MEEKMQPEEGISLLDIVRLLLSKIWILILIVAVSGILGGLLAVRRTIDINYWGTSVDFYVNPYSEETDTDSDSQYALYGAYGVHVMDGMVRLLNSDSFAEQLILDGASLPSNGDDWVNPENEAEVALDLNTKINEANAAITASNEANAARTLATEAHEKALEDLNGEWTMLYINKKVSFGTFNQAEYESVKDDPAYSTLKDRYEAVYAKETGTEALLDEAKQTSVAAATTANTAKETALNAWRKTAKYRSALSSYKGAVSFKYLRDSDSLENAQELAKSFIYAHISVLDNQDFARVLLEKVKKVVPMYVQTYMPVPAGYDGTNCQVTSTAALVHLTNPGYTKSQAIKMGLLFGAAAGIIACVVIIIIDRSNKKLRDYEVITKNFNVPVLGVVPTIDPLSEEPAKKKSNGKTEANK